ncbi:hypothetical protein ACQPYK_05680 [Streptosporangium sp. CA-135522]|uniref:hypothetical protein n=1 Tax=Streptosporangium sp. CA-135522 TaxID=3240072 RepID=UPI003D9401CD
MLAIRNALVAGTMAASALIAPVTSSAQAATTGTMAEMSKTTTSPILTSAQKPCSKHKNPAKCRARHGAGHGKSHGGGGGGGISDDGQPGLGGTGAGIDN